MKRVFLTVAIVLAVAFVLSGDVTNAVNNSFAERFTASGEVLKNGAPGTYNFDRAHSFVGFRIKHNGLIEVPGFFRDFTGSVDYDAKDVSKSSVNFTAKVTSIDTGIQGRDNHLRTADFFEVEKYPEMSFKSTKVEKKGTDWIVTGDLTLKGVIRSVSFPFQIAGFLAASERNDGRMGIQAETTINRRDFGVNYESKMASGLLVVADDVKIVLQIEAVKPKAAPATAPAVE